MTAITTIDGSKLEASFISGQGTSRHGYTRGFLAKTLDLSRLNIDMVAVILNSIPTIT